VLQRANRLGRVTVIFAVFLWHGPQE